jgi:arsenite methyltransferase
VKSPEQLRAGVHQAYSAAARAPESEHPFPVGAVFAAQLGYSPEHLARYPLAAGAFAGVSGMTLVADLAPGQTVLDLGCGAGLDTLIAAERVGPGGRVLGLDFSAGMLARARQAAAGRDRAVFLQGDAERLPLASASVDAALVNGIFNLNPARAQIFAELARVVAPGGQVFAAEIILREQLDPAEQASESNWFA